LARRQLRGGGDFLVVRRGAGQGQRIEGGEFNFSVQGHAGIFVDFQVSRNAGFENKSRCSGISGFLRGQTLRISKGDDFDLGQRIVLW